MDKEVKELIIGAALLLTGFFIVTCGHVVGVLPALFFGIPISLAGLVLLVLAFYKYRWPQLKELLKDFYNYYS